MPDRRILILVTDLQVGGTPTVVRELATRLHRSGKCEVEVACLSSWGPVADEITAGGVKVTALNADDVFDLPLTLVRLIKLIHRGRFDTVFSFLIHANALAALASRFARHVRYFQSIQTTQPQPRWHWHAQSFAQHIAEKVVVPSPSAARAANEWSGVPLDKIVVIPNAVDPAEFAGARLPAEGGQIRIGFIGRLDPIKRVPDLIHAVARLDERYHVEIVGEGVEHLRILDAIHSHGLQGRVRLTTGPARDVLPRMDVLVLPSAAEGFGLVLIEAMAARVPIVATNVAGIRDVIRNNQNGLLVPAGAPAQLAGAIIRIAEDAQLRGRLTAAGYAEVSAKYVWQRVLPMYEQLLELGE